VVYFSHLLIKLIKLNNYLPYLDEYNKNDLCLKNLKRFSEYLLLIIACILTLGLTLLFTRWEGLHLSDVGLLPGRRSTFRLGIGFLIGLILASLQPVLVLSFGHVKLALSPQITFGAILSNSGLYVLIACREELAFRGYPLRSLSYTMGGPGKNDRLPANRR
jgi:membrane protease YdiL (CAAX protease family)